MQRQMLVINIVLLAAAVGLAAKLRADWRRANQRYRALIPAGAPARPALTTAAGKAAAATDPDIIVQGNLFTPDRNNETPKGAVKPPPPEPILVGTLNLGSGKLALLADPSGTVGSMPRQVREGDTFGGYKLVRIGDNQVTLEYEGQQKKVDVSTAARQVPPPPTLAEAARPAPQTQVVNSASPAPATETPQVSSTGTSGYSGPVGPTGKYVFGTTHMYGYKDNLPAGAIVGNRRKVIRKTPNGEEVYWELIQPEERKP